jgi:hypothetical protein
MKYSGIQLEGQFDSHIGSSIIDPELSECGNCKCSEKEYWLFLHEPTSLHLCQTCLSKFIEADLIEDNQASFEGWTFKRQLYPYSHIEATNDGEVRMGYNVAEAVEMVLIKLKLI